MFWIFWNGFFAGMSVRAIICHLEWRRQQREFDVILRRIEERYHGPG
jgi:hypothetical protein